MDRVRAVASYLINLLFIFQTLSYIYIYSLNLLLLVWPEWLCFDWAMGCIPLIHSISDERMIFIAIFLITSLLFCLKLAKNFSNR